MRRTLIVTALPLVAAALVGCAEAPSEQTPPGGPATSEAAGLTYPVSAARTDDGFRLILPGPESEDGDPVEVAVVDPAGIVVSAAGAWLDATGDIGPGDVTALNPAGRTDVLEIRWAGACADRAVLLVGRTESGMAVDLSAERGTRASTCRPRGFVHVLVALALVAPVQAADVEARDMRPGFEDIP